MLNFIYNLATDKTRGFIPAIIKSFLLILSWVYGLIIRILVLFYSINSCRLACKVISVGNITLGGTGKTSLVEYIAKFLKQNGRNIAVLSRGYKNGDEPAMLVKNLGDIAVVIDYDRIRAAKKAIKDYAADTVILDDGFQQWKIRKDLEIVAIDATNPFGNRHILPRGILREPLSSLSRANLFVLTKTNLGGETKEMKGLLARINPLAEIFEAIHNPIGFYNVKNPQVLLSLERFQGQSVSLFSGIGDPDSFESLIRSLGIKVGRHFRFRDHHQYTKNDLDNIIKSSRKQNIDIIITTEKDAARLTEAELKNKSAELFVLKIELAIIKDEQKFHSRLLSLYSL